MYITFMKTFGVNVTIQSCDLDIENVMCSRQSGGGKVYGAKWMGAKWGGQSGWGKMDGAKCMGQSGWVKVDGAK